MEIYRNTNPITATLAVPSSIVTAGTTTVDVYLLAEGQQVHEFATVVPTVGFDGYTVSIPWEFTSEDRDFIISWRVKYIQNGATRSYDQTQFVQTVTPILPLVEVAAIGKADDDAEASDLERRVRYAIQSFTGQNFGKYKASMTFRGQDGPVLPLPAPLLGVYSTDFPINSFTISQDKFSLYSQSKQWFGIKDAPPEEILDQFYYTNGPILVQQNAGFSRERSYTVIGLWGYYDVPGDVAQAARLLVEDYSSDESLWRERYIESVRSGNWRFETGSGAFSGTGNILVDQILTPYRRLTLRAV